MESIWLVINPVVAVVDSYLETSQLPLALRSKSIFAAHGCDMKSSSFLRD
jgi:hypothetical protein